MSQVPINVFIFGLRLCAFAFSFALCDARTTQQFLRSHKNTSPRVSSIKKSTNKIVVSKHLDVYDAEIDDTSSNGGPYGVGSPFTIPPYDSLSPVYWPDQNTPPFCIDSPFMPLPTPAASGGGSGGGYTPLPPPSSSSNPTPTFPFPNPPLGPGGPNTGPSPSNPSTSPTPLNPGTGTGPSNPGTGPSPFNPGTGTSPPGFNPSPNPNPPIIIPSPTEPGLSPPYYGPSPPTIVIPRPPSSNSPPSIFIPSPPVFQPPVVFPPPAVPPPPRAAHTGSLWCVAKPTVPDPIIQEAMNYACGSGGDCGSIQPNGPCFQPDTLYAHASYAFNSYWQRTKVAGGTCDFGRTAMLVTVDPSYDGCHFVYY